VNGQKIDDLASEQIWRVSHFLEISFSIITPFNLVT